MSSTIFVTGTDTGVGKTVLTSLLLLHLRQRNVNALALKPFCSGGREDVAMLQALQPGILADDEVNPFFYSEPVAPFVATRSTTTAPVSLRYIRRYIRQMEARADLLIVEGAGGLMVPLEKKLFIADIVEDMQCSVVVVGRNQLGIINHTLLTVEALRARKVSKVSVVLFDVRKPDVSSKNNMQVLRKLIPSVPFFSLPRFRENVNKINGLVAVEKKYRKTLAQIVGHN